MIFKELGHTGTMISAIGQGSVDIGKYYDGISHDYNIRYGIDQGITFIDTAEVYTDGMSEIIIGKAIKGIRDKIVLSTKVSSDNLRYNDVIKSAECSLKRLQVDMIDLYQIHWSNIDIDISDTMMALEKLHKDGKIKHIGVSNFIPVEIDLSCHKDYSFGGIVSNQIEYNLYYRFDEKYSLPYCKDNGITIIAHSPLNRGDLFFINEKTHCLINNMSKKYNKSIYQISLNWLILHDEVIAIPFSINPKHIKQNAESTDFVLEKEDFDLLRDSMGWKLNYCNIRDIKTTNVGFRDHKVYTNKQEAIDNDLNFTPSPIGLSKFLLGLTEDQLKTIKPIKVVVSKDPNYKYDIVEGRIRYWSWVLAFGEEKDISLYIVDNNLKII